MRRANGRFELHMFYLKKRLKLYRSGYQTAGIPTFKASLDFI